MVLRSKRAGWMILSALTLFMPCSIREMEREGPASLSSGNKLNKSNEQFPLDLLPKFALLLDLISIQAYLIPLISFIKRFSLFSI